MSVKLYHNVSLPSSIRTADILEFTWSVQVLRCFFKKTVERGREDKTDLTPRVHIRCYARALLHTSNKPRGVVCCDIGLASLFGEMWISRAPKVTAVFTCGCRRRTKLQRTIGRLVGKGNRLKERLRVSLFTMPVSNSWQEKSDRTTPVYVCIRLMCALLFEWKHRWKYAGATESLCNAVQCPVIVEEWTKNVDRKRTTSPCPASPSPSRSPSPPCHAYDRATCSCASSPSPS
jgi:hypothetical protein